VKAGKSYSYRYISLKIGGKNQSFLTSLYGGGGDRLYRLSSESATGYCSVTAHAFALYRSTAFPLCIAKM